MLVIFPKIFHLRLVFLQDNTARFPLFPAAAVGKPGAAGSADRRALSKILNFLSNFLTTALDF